MTNRIGLAAAKVSHAFITLVAIIACSYSPSASAQSNAQDVGGQYDREVIQPVQEYFISPRDEKDGFRYFTHLGSDCGFMGPNSDLLTWHDGVIEADLRSEKSEWAGMWHSLEGLDREKDRSLDLQRCYPEFIRDEFQPRCKAIQMHVRGNGRIKVEIEAADGKRLWSDAETINSQDTFRRVQFPLPADLRRAKKLNWVVESGARLSIDELSMVLTFPDMPIEQRVFLKSYAKFARCYSPDVGIVKDRAHWPVGDFDSIPASGLFCLSTLAAAHVGVVDREFAVQTLERVHNTVSEIPRAKSLLAHFVRRSENGYRVALGTEYSTIDSSLYLHSMCLAAEGLNNGTVAADLETQIKQIRFNELINSDGFVTHGFKDDGETKLLSSWKDWGGETALVLMLLNMTDGESGPFKMADSGKVYHGVGFIAEIQSLFYRNFDSSEPDALTKVNWSRVRSSLLTDQLGYFPANHPGSAAARLGVYGLSAGEAHRGLGYAANGTESTDVTVVHPHYIRLSGRSHPDRDALFQTLDKMERQGLFPPWGMVENTNISLDEYLPMLGSLNAAFETISAYHLWAASAEELDHIYEAARTNRLTSEAIRVFYTD